MALTDVERIGSVVRRIWRPEVDAIIKRWVEGYHAHMDRYTQGVKAEKRVAKAYGGKTQPGSGSKWFARGDVATPHLLVQVKNTRTKTFTLKLADLQSLEQQAASTDREPLFLVEFSTPKGQVRYQIRRDWTPKESA